MLWISSQSKVLRLNIQLDLSLKNREVESKSSKIQCFCHYTRLSFSQIFWVLERKQATFKGGYVNPPLAKKLLLIQFKANGNIWIMNPK